MAEYVRARLHVVSDKQQGRSYLLDHPRLTIGRGLDNDVVTDDPEASRQHAEVQRAGATGPFYLLDAKSANGTLVNGRRVARVELRHGDRVQIGNFSFVFQTKTASGPAPTRQLNPTVLAPPGGTPPPSAGAVPDAFPLRAQGPMTVGRDARNDIVLDHPQVSRRHACLQLRPEGTLSVTDLRSTNGTFVEGQQVHGATTVAAGATLTFGPFRLLYQHGQLIKVTDDGTIRIDCLGVSKTVAGGKTLLHDLTFSILPREFVCLVGGSGAGKSTLLDAIAGVRPANGGEIRYNGADYYLQLDSYRSAIGYVPQDDIVPAELTVERALYYAARLRLPEDMAGAEVKARVQEVLDDLGLGARRDVPIKNLSGGQRKRVSIGAELLAKPTLFFLDEPTSGLDPGLEERMMTLLRKLADQGRTVVLITHATQNVDLCDSIAFLAPGGYLAYYGPPQEALAYFGVRKFAEIYTKIEQEPRMEEWARRFRAAPEYARNVTARLQPGGHGPSGAGNAHAVALAQARGRSPAARKVSTLRQFAILSRRYLETVWRDRKNLLTLLIQAPVIALMIVAGFHESILDKATGNRLDASTLLFVLAMVAVWFGMSNAAREIVKEAAIYARERRINLRLAPYIGSKVVVLLGLGLIQNLVLLAPLSIAGAPPPSLPLLYAVLLAGSLAGIGMGLAISAQASNPDRASSLVPLLLIPQVIFAGAVIDLHDNAIVNAISHFTVTKWTYRALGALVDLDAFPRAGSFRDFGDFGWHPAVYLLLTGLFVGVSLVGITLFLRRKDIVR